MTAYSSAGRLRNRFDEAHHPAIQGRPFTHHREYYLATDGSQGRGSRGRLGVVLETFDGITVGAWSREVEVVDNNDAELRALHWGLDLLATRSPSTASVGVLLDHDVLATALAEVLAYEWETAPSVPIPTASPHHWGGILARLCARDRVRVGVIPSARNPAHARANARTGLISSRTIDRCVRVPTMNRCGPTPNVHSADAE